MNEDVIRRLVAMERRLERLQSIEDAIGGSSVPRVTVRKTVNQTGFTPSTFTKITFDTIDTQTPASSFSTVNSRWTPGISGTYLLTGTILLNSPTEDAARYILSVYKTGVRTLDYQYSASGTTFQAIPVVFALLPLSASDYIELWLNPITVAAASVYGGPFETTWSAFRLGP